MGVCAQQFLDYDGVERHPQRNRKSCPSSESFQALILYGHMCKYLYKVSYWALVCVDGVGVSRAEQQSRV